ncbi:MAG: LCP family protein [Solirubrobacterales bacterium]
MFEEHEQERFAPWKRFIAGSLVMVLVAAAVVSLTAFAERKDVTQTIAPIPGLDKDVIPGPVGGAQTILLIGSDERNTDKKYGLRARSDTMMLLRLDPHKKVITALSIPRDLKVTIPGRGVAKFNESYELGGAPLVVKTIKQATGLEVNHVMIVNFKGFSQAVDKIGCVYTDVDRKYFNNNVGRYIGDQFAAIDVKAGYQKLCGTKALQYVRFRHFDNDLLRAARQQSFLRQAKQQVGIVKFVTNANKLKSIVAHNLKTDQGLKNGANFQRLLKLAVTSAGNAVYQVTIPNVTTPTEGGVSYVVASESSLHKAARIFKEGPTQKGDGSTESTGSSKKKKKKKTSGNLSPGLVFAKDEGKTQAVAAGFGIALPVFYPTVKLAGATYQDPRSYRLTTPDNKRVSAYRIVAKTNKIGEYYGVQGVNWDDPPILQNPSESRKVGGRNYDLYYEGSKLGMVAFHRNGASYWVQNTLTRLLTEKQMLGIAKSLRMRK